MPLYNLGDSIQAIRENIYTFKTDLVFRDGNSIDPRNSEDPIASISITRLLNVAFDRLALATGYTAGNVSLNVTAGTAEYDFPATTGVVLSIDYLRASTYGVIKARHPANKNSDVAYYYYVLGTNKIGFYPAPTQNGTKQVFHIASPNLLSVLSDTPSKLPSIYGDIPIQLASLYCASLDAENPTARARAVFLAEEVKGAIESMRVAIGVMADSNRDTPIDGPLPTVWMNERLAAK